jgi:hypothetical protein
VGGPYSVADRTGTPNLTVTSSQAGPHGDVTAGGGQFIEPGWATHSVSTSAAFAIVAKSRS